MSDDPASPAAVGQQLAQRRTDLDLTQDQLAERIRVRARTVSAIETGKNSIQRSSRSTWEQALRLKPGTISRAYSEGSPIEVSGPEDRDTPVHPSSELSVEQAVSQLKSELAELREEVNALKQEKAAIPPQQEDGQGLDAG